MITLVTPHETKLMDKLRMCSEALRDSTEQCRVYRAEIDQWSVDYNEMKIERDALALDASRYRWLRNQDEHQFRALAYETPEWVDAYIDAMKGTS